MKDYRAYEDMDFEMLVAALEKARAQVSALEGAAAIQRRAFDAMERDYAECVAELRDKAAHIAEVRRIIEEMFELDYLEMHELTAEGRRYSCVMCGAIGNSDTFAHDPYCTITRARKFLEATDDNA
jgi:rubrerythrin